MTKEELIGGVWQGKAVGDDALTSCVQELRNALGDDARRPRFLETLHRRGYRWLVEVSGAADGSEPVPPGLSTTTDKLAVAVLPFIAIADDPGARDFADGLSEDITIELSRFHSLFVIAWSSSRLYRGNDIDDRQVSGELGVEYLVRGTVRLGKSKARIAVELVEGETRRKAWSERYDRSLEDVFEVQEQVTRSIVAAVAPQVETSEHRRLARRPPENLQSWQIGMRAMSLARESFGRSDGTGMDEALQLAEQALSLDGGNVRAHCVRAYVFWMKAHHRLVPPAARLDTLGAALGIAHRALGIDAGNFEVHSTIGYIHGTAGRLEDALQAMLCAHELNPNDAWTLNGLGWVENMLGASRDAIRHMLQALRLNPRDPWIGVIYSSLADAYFINGQYAESIQWGLKAKHALPNFVMAFNVLALSHAALGQMGEARRAVDEMRRTSPDFLEQRLAGQSNYRRPEDRARAVEFLRQAAAFGPDEDGAQS